MNSQNILKFYGSKLNLKLDTSEFYDYEVSKVDDDYNSDVLEPYPITYTGLTIDDSLENFSSVRNTISLFEFDNTIYDTGYTYSGLSFIFDYYDFVSYFDTTGYTYDDVILNNDIFTYTGITGETHYFYIEEYNNTTLDSSNLITGFTTDIITCSNKLSGSTVCCPQSLMLDNKPWAYKFDTGYGSDNCSQIIQRRPEKGWTLDFVFNREGLNWSNGSVFYYFGVRGDDDLKDYADNNLSFQFTPDGKIKWTAIHYSGYCNGASGYTESYYTSTGQTPTLCVSDNTKDFNVTIVFDRYNYLTDCNLENDGGKNDLITGRTLNNSALAVMTGDTPDYSYPEILNQKWGKERQKRLGVLKIYLNGRPIYKIKDWEEIVPSDRGVQPFIQSWGGGTGMMGDIHNGICEFNIKSIKYYEEPLDFIHVKHNFLSILNDYDFYLCGIFCVDNLIGLTTTGLLAEDSENLLQENNALLLY